VCASAESAAIASTLAGHGERVFEIGQVIEAAGDGPRVLIDHWDRAWRV
jgi:hypothetical protein